MLKKCFFLEILILNFTIHPFPTVRQSSRKVHFITHYHGIYTTHMQTFLVAALFSDTSAD